MDTRTRPTLARVVMRPLVVAAVCAGIAAVVLALPGATSAQAATAAVGAIVGSALPVVVCWFASAWGVGMVVARALGFAANRPVELALGCAVMAWVDQVVGVWVGLSPTAVWTTAAPGLVALVVMGVRGQKRNGGVRGRASWAVLLGAPAAGLMISAACLPPGTIWGSEAGGYDVLSYHLELPKEWIARGRIWPTDHNVYSCLPSFMEGVFAHLAVMAGVRSDAGPPLGAGPGAPVHAAQLAHVAFALLAAWCVAGAVRELMRDGDTEESRIGAIAAGAAMVSIPWVIVTGSMAYNEMAMCAMIGGAMICAAARTVGALGRGVAVGVLIGGACGFKPTAMFLGMPVAALVLAARTDRNAWVRAIGVAAVAGAIMIAPWMVRNAMATGNPVFPSAAGVFGDGWWTSAQHARWNGEHHPAMSIADRIARVFSTDYGLGHAQWSIWGFVALGAAVVCLAVPRVRRSMWPVVVGLGVQVIAWMFVGHLQSRFLIPIAVTSAVAVGAAIDAMARSNARLGVAAAVVVPLVVAGDSIRLFLRENNGNPNIALVAGVEVMNGSVMPRVEGDIETSHDVRTYYIGAGPTEFLNRYLLPREPDARVLLMGDATPFYLNDVGDRVWYATVWDSTPIVAALDACGEDVDCVIGRLREAGFTHMLINAAELDRLRRSGYSDPRVTPELGLAIARRLGVMMPWPDRGQALVALGDGEGGDGRPVDSPGP